MSLHIAREVVPFTARRNTTPDPQAAPAPQATAVPATSVGILGAEGTVVVMVPAQLVSQSDRTDITQFTISLDAGTY